MIAISELFDYISTETYAFVSPTIYFYCGCSDADELRIKEETGATIRCFPFEQPQGTKTCLMTGKPADEVAIFAKSY